MVNHQQVSWNIKDDNLQETKPGNLQTGTALIQNVVLIFANSAQKSPVKPRVSFKKQDKKSWAASLFNLAEKMNNSFVWTKAISERYEKGVLLKKMHACYSNQTLCKKGADLVSFFKKQFLPSFLEMHLLEFALETKQTKSHVC